MRAARVRSRLESHGLSADRAGRLWLSDFGDVVAGAAWNPAVALRRDHVIRYLDRYRALVRVPGGGRRLAISTVPLLTGPSGPGRQVDLALGAAGSGWAPRDPAVRVAIPSVASDGVAVGGEGVRIVPLVAGLGSGQLRGGSVFYPGGSGDVDAAAVPTVTGVELFSVLRSRLAAEQLTYRVQLPVGATLRSAGTGAEVVADGRVLVTIPPPVARDAQRTLVPVEMSVSGDVLELSVRHRERDVAYPLEVDPSVVVPNASMGGWTFTPDSTGMISGTVGSGGSAMSAPPGTYPSGDMGALTWTTSSAEIPGVLTSVQFANLVDRTAGEFGGEIHIACGPVANGDVVAGGGWNDTTASSWTVGPPLVDTHGQACVNTVQIDMYTFSSMTTTTTASWTIGGILLTVKTSGPSRQELWGSMNRGEPNVRHVCKGHPVNCATGNQYETQTDLSAVSHGLGLGLVRTYNSQAAAVASASGAFGYGWSGSYSDHLVIDPTDQIATVYQENGSTVPFDINTDGSFSSGGWVQATLVKQSDGTYLYTLPDQSTFVFDSAGRLTKETDRNGNAIGMSYDTNGHLVAATDATGRSISFSYNADGTVSSATDPANDTARYSYTSGNLTQVVAADGGVWKFGYDASHQLTSMTDPDGRAITTSYDASNRVTSQTDAFGTRYWSYASDETVITNPAGDVTDEVFQNNQPVSITYAKGTSLAGTRTIAYDPNGNPISETDQNSHTWNYGYDAAGNRTSVQDPNGHTTSRTYDAQRDVTSVTTPLGHQTTFAYDAHGNLTSVSRIAAGQTQTIGYGYDAAGDRTSMTDPLGKTWTYGYDGYGDLTSVIDPLGNKATYGYDAIGRRTSMVSPRGNVTGGNPASFTTTYAYDALSRMTSETDPLGHTQSWSYDPVGNLISHTDERNNSTSYSYNAANEPTTTTRPNGTTLQSSYDANGNVSSQTDGAGKTTTYSYDPLGRVTSVTTPLGKSTSYGYDKAGNRTTVTDPDGRITTDGFDAANELTSITYSDGHTPNVSYTYTADGQRATMVDGTGTTSYSYDSLDRVQNVTNGAGSAIAYAYDLANNITAITYPGGHTVSRAFDADGRLSALTDWKTNTTTFGYDPNSNLLSTTFPDTASTVDTTTYDNSDRIMAINSSQTGGPLFSIAYTRNPSGQVLSETDTGLPAPASQAYTYNTLGQLASASSTGTYSYDAADNPTVQHGSTFNYNNDNELTTSGGSTWTFNNEGQRVANNWTTATMSYGYDQAGNLTSVTQPAYGTTAAVNNTYTYDGDGNRVSLNQSGSQHAFTWDISGSLPRLGCENSSCYIYGPAGPVEMIDGNGNPTFFHLDQQGSVRMITKPNGTNVGAYTYDPYGRVLAQTGSAFTRLEYDGQWFESVSNLFNLLARNYDPKTGQFMSRDPFAAQTRQSYLYAAGDPVNRSDPSGLSVFGGACDPWDIPCIANVDGTYLGKHGGAIAGAAGDVVTVSGCAIPGIDVSCAALIAGDAALQSTLAVAGPGSAAHKAALVGVNLLLAGYGGLGAGAVEYLPKDTPGWVNPFIQASFAAPIAGYDAAKIGAGDGSTGC